MTRGNVCVGDWNALCDLLSCYNTFIFIRTNAFLGFLLTIPLSLVSRPGWTFLGIRARWTIAF